MENITELYNIIISDTLYTIIAIAFLILIGFGIIKKLFKLTLIIIACTIVYLAVIYFTQGPEEAANKLDEMGGAVMNMKDTIEEGAESLKNP